MSTCVMRMDPALCGFLRPALRGGPVTSPLDGVVPVLDRIQALGVPHTEVGRIMLRHAGADETVEVAPDQRLVDGDEVTVLPVTAPQPWPEPVGEVSADLAGHPPPDGTGPAFVLDGHLGRLAAYLRLLGFDVLHRTDAHDDELAAVAATGTRILLSRDIGLLRRSAVRHGAFVYATDPLAQLREVHDRFGLAGHGRPLTRCAVCNTPLRDGAAPSGAASGDGRLRAVGPGGTRADTGSAEPVDVVAPAPVAVPADVLARGLLLRHCPRCGRTYWVGGHLERLRARFASIGVDLR
ncbi:Mut7-C RNAse domain-containing protein [Tersicoccus sp. MR15.9]|uniref:Mut7-C RNAse domain-containing protein n=1 Tax=Tersicoccus mangrovi TaxID=3121635 RepID=UPI002FE683CE